MDRRKVEFQTHFKKQVQKLGTFLSTWAGTLKTVEPPEDALKHLVIEFSPQSKRVINYDAEFSDQSGFKETEYLTRAVFGVQATLKKLFFPSSSAGETTDVKYLATLIEELWASSECTLNTFFRVGDLDEVEDDAPLQIDLQDTLPSIASTVAGDLGENNKLN